MRRWLLLALVPLLLASGAQARRHRYVVVYPIVQALERARIYWRSQGDDPDLPCGGQIAITEQRITKDGWYNGQRLPHDGIPAESTYTKPSDSAPPSTWSSCSINFNADWWDRRITLDAWLDLCAIATHELGHYATGIDESSDPNSIMYLYAGPDQAPPVCHARPVVRRLR